MALALSPSFGYLGNKEEVERNIAERERDRGGVQSDASNAARNQRKVRAHADANGGAKRLTGVVRFLADASLHDGIVSRCRRREPTMAKHFGDVFDGHGCRPVFFL